MRSEPYESLLILRSAYRIVPNYMTDKAILQARVEARAEACLSYPDFLIP